MSDYTLTTEEVRALYIAGTPTHIGLTRPSEEFNRWLAAHDQEVAAQEREKIADDIDNGVVEYDDLRGSSDGAYWITECIDDAYDSSGVWTDWLRRTAAAIRSRSEGDTR